jgi:hypothetical protein
MACAQRGGFAAVTARMARECAEAAVRLLFAPLDRVGFTVKIIGVPEQDLAVPID